MVNIGRRLIHYSTKPLTKVDNKKQDTSHHPWKPHGLWVSAEGEDDWLSWCRVEQFRLNCYTVATEVILKPEAKILHIKTVQEHDAFERKYTVSTRTKRPNLEVVKWDEVAKKYQGIVISPYCYERRLSRSGTIWYYTWDCASGCIWDAGAVAELRPCVGTEGFNALTHLDADQA